MVDRTNDKPLFVICIDHGGYPESLEPLKLYQVLPDPDAAKHGQLRIIDESGEDYLYFEKLFIKVDFPSSVQAELSRVIGNS